jgi:hypothetical protein
MKGDFKFCNNPFIGLYLYQDVKQYMLCTSCSSKKVVAKISTLFMEEFQQFNQCSDCIGDVYFIDLVKDVINDTKMFKLINLLNFLNIEEIPKYVFYEIGKSMKTLFCGSHNRIVHESIATFNTTCDSTRRAIREFCLYCIRYQKDRVNKDIRRKICELIWKDKIKFIS